MARSDKVRVIQMKEPSRGSWAGVCRLKGRHGQHPTLKEASGLLVSLSTHFLCCVGLLEIMTPHQSLLATKSNGISV